MNRLYQLFSVFIGLGFLYFFYHLLEQNESKDFSKVLSSLNPVYLVLSLLCYLASHFLRGMRIAILMGRQDYSLLTLTKMQFYTNSINLIIPFKLGEIYRVLEFNKLFKEKEKLIISIITEKAVDLVLLLFWAVLAIYFLNNQSLPIFDLSILMVLAVIFITFVFFVVPENFKYLNLFLAKRYTNKKANKILALSTTITKTTESIKKIIKTNFYTLFLLTIGIWSFEVLGFLYLFPLLSKPISILALSVFVFLSSLIPTLTLGLGSIQLAFSTISLEDPSFNSWLISFSYQLFIFTPAVILGFIIYFLPNRIKK